MMIILIHWRIKPTEEHIHAFRKYWREQATINNDNGLIGEFLSEPIKPEQVKYPIDGVLPKEEKSCVSFINVGIWKNNHSFHDQVGKNIPPLPVLKEFEQYPRRRIPLEPEFWRRGKFQLPVENNL